MSYYGRSKKQMVRDELEAFVEAAGGQIITPQPGSLPDGEYYIPRDEQWTTATRENPGTRWAPQPPYFGEELANLVSHTPFDRGQDPDIYEYLPQFDVVQPYKPLYMDGGAKSRNFGASYGAPYGAYGFLEEAPKAPLNKSQGSAAQYKKLAAALAAVQINIPADYNKYDQGMINAVKQFQSYYMGAKIPSGAYDVATQGKLEQLLKQKDQQTLLDLGKWGLDTWLNQMGGGSEDIAIVEERPRTNWPVIIGVGTAVVMVGILAVAFAGRGK